jgi:hypothetical protein
MYIPKYFKLYELLPKEFYEGNKHKGDRLWAMFDDRILYTQDRLRLRYGPMICNDWHWGGYNQYRGWRPFDCKIGAYLSQHKFARAIDSRSTKVSSEEIRKDIRSNIWHEDFKYITCIEDGVSWLHISCQNWDKKEKGLLIIRP